MDRLEYRAQLLEMIAALGHKISQRKVPAQHLLEMHHQLLKDLHHYDERLTPSQYADLAKEIKELKDRLAPMETYYRNAGQEPRRMGQPRIA